LVEIESKEPDYSILPFSELWMIFLSIFYILVEEGIFAEEMKYYLACLESVYGVEYV
jgi:hypothetical protein